MKVFFAGIIAAIASLFGGPYHAPAPANSMPAAAATVVTTHTVNPGFAASEPVSGTTTIVNNYVTNPVVERVVETRALDTSVLDEKIQAFRNDMLLRIAQIAYPAINFSGPAPNTPVSVASFAASQKIDSLTNVTLTNATVNGVSGLTDADIPDGITASNYLPLIGGTLSFASSTLFSAFNNAYFGATATSSFDSAGALTLATPLLVSSGGTGASTFGQGWIYSSGGTGALAASTSPTVDYIIATSTTHASTFGYRVGVGSTSPAYKLAVVLADPGAVTSNNDQIFIQHTAAGAYPYAGLTIDHHNLAAGNQGGASVTFSNNGTIEGTLRFDDSLGIPRGLGLLNSTSDGPIYFETNASAGGVDTAKVRMIITNSGSIGIGNTSPAYKFDVTGAGHFTSYVDAANFVATSTSVASTFAYNVGIGTTTPYSRLTVWGPDTAAGTAAFLIANSASTTEFAVYDDGSATLAGTLTQNSDVRLKTNVESLNTSSTLGLIAQLNPVIFHWADPAKSATPQLGFIAQDVQKVFPELVSTTSPTALTPDGTLGLNYIGFIAPIVEAIKALIAEVGDLADKLTTKELVATNIMSDTGTFGKLCVRKSDGTPVCVNGDQLAAAVAGANTEAPTSGPSGNSAPPEPKTTPPVITIAGENPAHIQIGDTYNDLGAIAKDAAGHDLSVKLFLNGALVSDIVLDTAAAATDTIDYVATDGGGTTSTSTRTVIIEAATAVAPSQTSDAPATTTAQ